jgi:alpha-tubulin suppressor-like RCC1 family protein
MALAMGQSHACALAKSGQISCWGATDELTNGGFSRAQASPVRVKGLESAVALSAYGTTSCAVTRDGSAWCWRWSRRKAGEQIGAERVFPGAQSPRP